MLAAADTIPLTGYGQLGAVGVVLVTFLWFGWQVYKRERERADRNEAEIARLNQKIADVYVPTLEKWLVEAGEQRRLVQAFLDEKRTSPAPRRRT